jgi:hypothetical protein
MDLEENIIKKWEGTKELGKIFSITSLYKAIKLNKQYKNFLWKQNN